MGDCIAITGCGGFVAPYLAQELRRTRPGIEIVGTALELEAVPECFDRVARLDVTDGAAVERFFTEYNPAEIFHLAGLSRPATSAGAEFYAVNTMGTLHVVSSALAAGSAILLVSSAYVYGATPRPFTESDPVNPVNHYGASKYAGELAALVAARAGGRLVIARPFNHAGPGQSEDFFLGSMVRQIVTLEQRGGSSLHLGNLSPIRDYTDVRDVVRAYQLLMQRGENGSVYNVASGRSVTMGQILSLVLERAKARLEVVEKLTRQRPVDLVSLVGDASRLNALGWRPEIPLEETVITMLEFERARS